MIDITVSPDLDLRSHWKQMARQSRTFLFHFFFRSLNATMSRTLNGDADVQNSYITSCLAGFLQHIYPKEMAINAESVHVTLFLKES